MKSVILSLGVLAAAVVAQDISSLPQCAQTCANNMLASSKAEELGCKEGDFKCLCLNPNFTYGLRDCSLVTCDSNEDQVQDAINYGLSFCSNAGVAITTGSGGSVSGTATGTGGSGSATTGTGATATGDEAIVSTIVSVFTSGTKAITTPIATTTFGGAGGGAGGLVTTITSGGSTFVTTLASDASGAASTAASDLSSIASDLGSEASSLGSAFTSATRAAGSATETTEGSDETGTATESDGSATSTTTDDAAIPQKTAAPAGIIAAAGILALFL